MSQKSVIFASEQPSLGCNKTFIIMEKNNNGHHIQREITPLSDKDCFYVVDRHKTDFTYPLHCHGEYEINFIEHGNGLRRIVGDSIETVGEYDLVLIATSDLEHVWEQGDCKSEDIREITIQFSPHFFDSLIDTNQFARVKAMLEKARNGLCFPVTAIMKVYSLIDTLPETKGFSAVTQFLTMLYELSFFTDEARALSTSSFANVNMQANSRRVQKVQQFINEHYRDEIHLGMLAELVGMTPTAFSRFFRQRTGKRLSDYVIDIRLGHASRMLVDTTMSVAEICYDCGFNNLSNFNRIFKRKKNSSPTEFREMYFKKKVII